MSKMALYGGSVFTVAGTKGAVRVVDIMGDDSSIVQSARVSYGKGTKHVSKDERLINYLWKHQHTSPFEMCEIKLHIKAPMFVARQWLRHRTASVNELSARYSEMQKDFYLPDLENICEQSTDNKQGRGAPLHPDLASKVRGLMEESCDKALETYEALLSIGVSRELARIIIPTGFYTEFYWKIDLHNLLKFLKLRTHKTAQLEIRQYADIILHEIVKEWTPMVYKAFMASQ